MYGRSEGFTIWIMNSAVLPSRRRVERIDRAIQAAFMDRAYGLGVPLLWNIHSQNWRTSLSEHLTLFYRDE